MVGRTKQASRGIRKEHNNDRRPQRYQCSENEGLRHVHPCDPLLAPRQMDGRHDGASGAQHQRHAHEQHQHGNADVDSGHAVAAHAVPHEDAVDSRYGRHAQHPQQRGNEILVEKPEHIHTSQINSVSFHILIFHIPI